jgi:hypothetical protein
LADENRDVGIWRSIFAAEQKISFKQGVNGMLIYAEMASQMRLPTDIKKGSVQHVHLFELIEMHKKFVLARARASNDYGPEGSLGARAVILRPMTQ